MDQARLLRLWADKDLCEFVRSQARRYFQNDQDREDACAEAWERIAYSPTKLSMKNIKKVGKNAISAFYMRERRRRYRDSKIKSVNITAQKLPEGVNG